MARPLVRTRVNVQIGGHDLQFRPLTSVEIEDLREDIKDRPAYSLEFMISACREACVSDVEDFDRAADDYPLSFEGVLRALVEQCYAEAKERVRLGVNSWKRADRNPGLMAEDLLAFKGYSGGDYSASEFAGALAVADLVSACKGLLELGQNWTRALNRRR